MIARPIAGAPRPYRFPDFVQHRLANGLGVWLVPLPDRELVSIHLLTDAGAAAEDEAPAGIAALTAQLLVTGTQRLDAAAFAETTERLGIEVGSESSWDSARAGFTALGRKLDDGLALLAEMIRTPRLDPRRVRSAQGRAPERHPPGARRSRPPGRRELPARGLRRWRAVRPAVGRPPETVEPLSVDDARAFHATHYAPNVADVVDRRRDRSGRDPRRGRAAPRRLGRAPAPGHRTIEPAQRGGRRVVLVDRPGSVQSELRVGHLGIDRLDARYFPALVMAALLGGVFGSRLNMRLREELGYTYGARCCLRSAPRGRPVHGHRGGPDRGHGRRDPRAARPAGAHSRGGARPSDELAEVRDFLVGVFPLRFETTGGIAGGHRAARGVRPAAPTGGRPTATTSRPSGPPRCMPWRASWCGRTRRSSCSPATPPSCATELEAADLGPVEVVAAS